jgi:hypothetical protein
MSKASGKRKAESDGFSEEELAALMKAGVKLAETEKKEEKKKKAKTTKAAKASKAADDDSEDMSVSIMKKLQAAADKEKKKGGSGSGKGKEAKAKAKDSKKKPAADAAATNKYVVRIELQGEPFIWTVGEAKTAGAVRKPF